ncbi:MAG: Lipoprotein LpqB, GerMN domain [Paenibacillaceae bacterium]|jgi:hypothetical protein|nr:Lipoprotein LpqB, GerMN domain [Paenibacillaceae bacterium]
MIMQKLKIAAISAVLLAAAGCAMNSGGDSLPVQGQSPSQPIAATVSPSPDQPAPASPSSGQETASPKPGATPAVAHEPEQLVKDAAAKAVAALKGKDMKTLASLVHPDKGVRISPYSFVDTKNHLVFTPEQVSKLADASDAKVWGSYDGTGDPIKLTPLEYYDKFLYNHDYAAAEKISLDQTMGKGNSINNIQEVYPGSHYAEYYFSGFDPKLEGMDWASLTFVFEEKDGAWYLTGLVNGRWTI